MSKSDKLPALQFYPGDWLKDIGVQCLNYHDQGVWFTMLLHMHSSEERGVLVLKGQPMSSEDIAQMLGLDNQTFNQTLTKLLAKGVADVQPKTGAIMSRRMVRDEELRKTRKNCGKLGGNPFLVNQNPTTRVKQKSTPSSSSSSSVLKEKRAASGFELPDWVPRDAWNGWLESRKKNRHATTDRALEIAVKRLDECRKMGQDPAAVLDQATERAYRGIFPLSQDRRGEAPGGVQRVAMPQPGYDPTRKVESDAEALQRLRAAKAKGRLTRLESDWLADLEKAEKSLACQM